MSYAETQQLVWQFLGTYPLHFVGAYKLDKDGFESLRSSIAEIATPLEHSVIRFKCKRQEHRIAFVSPQIPVSPATFGSHRPKSIEEHHLSQTSTPLDGNDLESRSKVQVNAYFAKRHGPLHWLCDRVGMNQPMWYTEVRTTNQGLISPLRSLLTPYENRSIEEKDLTRVALEWPGFEIL